MATIQTKGIRNGKLKKAFFVNHSNYCCERRKAIGKRIKNFKSKIYQKIKLKTE